MLSRRDKQYAGLIFLKAAWDLIGIDNICRQARRRFGVNAIRAKKTILYYFLTDIAGIRDFDNPDLQDILREFFALPSKSRLPGKPPGTDIEIGIPHYAIEPMPAYKITFANGFYFYLDPYFKSLWGSYDSIPWQYVCFSPAVQTYWQQIFTRGSLPVLSLPCFGNVSALVFRVLEGFSKSRILKIEGISRDGRVVEEIKPLGLISEISIGYHPRQIQTEHKRKLSTASLRFAGRQIKVVLFTAKISLNKSYLELPLVDIFDREGSLLWKVIFSGSAILKDLPSAVKEYLLRHINPQSGLNAHWKVLERASFSEDSIGFVRQYFKIKQQRFMSVPSLIRLLELVLINKFGLTGADLKTILVLPGDVFRLGGFYKKIVFPESSKVRPVIEIFNQMPIFYCGKRVILSLGRQAFQENVFMAKKEKAHKA